MKSRFFYCAIFLLTACDPYKSLIIENNSNKKLSILLPSGTKQPFFKDSVLKIEVAPQKYYLTPLGFGLWQKKDVKALYDILNGSKTSFDLDSVLSKKINVRRIGLLNNTLKVKIR